MLEVRKKNGDNYPAETLYEVLICIQLYLTMPGRVIKLLDEGNFLKLRNTLDNRMKELSSLGIVKPRSKARVITLEENMLWQCGMCQSIY